VWSGTHFRFADEQGARIGTSVARWADHHYFRPVRDHDGHDGQDDDGGGGGDSWDIG
jgi:hypothetical protein